MMMMEFSIFPVGAGESLSGAVARAVKIVEESGLPYRVTDMGTIIEGTPEKCFGVVLKCIKNLSKDFSRLNCTIKIDYRQTSSARIGRKAKKVLALLNKGKV